MKQIFKKIISALIHSPYTMPVCSLVAVIAVLYSAYTARDMIRQGDEWHLTPQIWMSGPEGSEPLQDSVYIPEHDAEQDRSDAANEGKISVFSTEVIIDRPDASMQEPSNQPETEIIWDTTQEEISSSVTNATTPSITQKPTQTTKPQTSRPTTQTTKPAQTTKPSQSTKPQASVTGWNVTLSQAKKMVKKDSAYDYEDLYWLSRIISAEAKGESFTGQIGVGTVVLNRVKSKQFPNTVKGVVFDQKYGTQFTPVANGAIYESPTQSAVVAAKMCLDGYTLSNSVLYFLNPSIATSSWIQNHRKYAFRVGNHEFYY